MNKEQIPYLYLYLLVLVTGLFSISIVAYGAEISNLDLVEIKQLEKIESRLNYETYKLDTDKNVSVFYSKDLLDIEKPIEIIPEYPDNWFSSSTLSVLKWFTPTVLATEFSSTADGWIKHDVGSGGGSWASVRGGAGTDVDNTTDVTGAVDLAGANTSNTWWVIRRAGFIFDTSSIPDTDTIDSAEFKLYVHSKIDNFSDSVSLTTFTPASDTTFVASDYATFSTTKYASDKTISSLTTSAYNSWNLTDLSIVSKTDKTRLGLRLTDDNDNTEPTWSGGNPESYVAVRYSEYTGTASDPVLIVVHSAGASGGTNATSTPFSQDTYWDLLLLSEIVTVFLLSFYIVFRIIW